MSRKFFTPPQPSPNPRGGSKKFTNDARIAIDVLATFEPDFHWTLLKLMQMEEELQAIFERKVDLVSKSSIEQSLNYLRRKAMLN